MLKMKIKRYKDFLENAESSGVSGMGSVVSAQPGSLPGTTGSEGSGDIGFTFKKEKRKKGGPSEVTDLRDLEDTKEITNIKDIKENISSIKRDPNQDNKTRNDIEDCLFELFDNYFELNFLDYNKERMSIDLDDEETGYFDEEELRLTLHKVVERKWIGNNQVIYKFNKNGIIDKSPLMTLRSQKGLTPDEKELVDIVEDCCHKMINILNYESGDFSISWLVAGSAMPFNQIRNINVNINITLRNILKY
jgi:hypothetical protein